MIVNDQRRPASSSHAAAVKITTHLNCIIVEDEPLAAELMADYIGQISFLNLTHTCNDALQALDVVRANPKVIEAYLGTSAH